MTVTNIGINPPPEETEEPEHRPLLEVWRALLQPARDHASEPVGLQWAVRLKAAYPHLSFAEIDAVRVGYFEKLNQLIDILHYEIESDPDCLTHRTVESDAAENAVHYKSLVLLWQQAFLVWESEWLATNESAAVDAACIAEVHKMFFGQMGLLGHLDTINFEFNEDDQAELAVNLAEFNESLRGGTGE